MMKLKEIKRRRERVKAFLTDMCKVCGEHEMQITLPALSCPILDLSTGYVETIAHLGGFLGDHCQYRVYASTESIKPGDA
jgi:hypothetical protein